MSATTVEADIEINGSGTVYMVQACNERAVEWTKEYVDVPEGWGPRYYPVEHRYIEDLVNAFDVEGFKVTVNGKIVGPTFKD